MIAQQAGLASLAPFPSRGRARGRADIHFHLLPGVDDGPETLEESAALAALALRDGTTTIVATPHVRGDFVTDVGDLPDRVREVRERLRRDGLDVDVCLGAELGHDMVERLTESELDLVAQGPPGGRWVLLETPFAGLTAEFAAAAAELRARGFACVLAHPERAMGVLDDECAALRAELDAGGALQISGSSLAGWRGEIARETGFALAREHRAVIASDAHGPESPPALSTAVEAALVRGLSPALARGMVDLGPRALLQAGLPLPLPAAA
jgi:protein-tyrosine phosphatase